MHGIFDQKDFLQRETKIQCSMQETDFATLY